MADTDPNPTTAWPELYARLRRDSGDPIAHSELRARIGAWARRDLWSRGWHTVEDVIAHTIETVWVQLDQARGADTFQGFVYGHYRSARRQVTRPRCLTLVPLTEQVDPVDPSASPGADRLDESERALIGRALAALSERERAAVELHCLRELPYQQIARILQVDELNARQIAFRGRARMRRYLEEAWTGARSRRGVPSLASDAV